MPTNDFQAFAIGAGANVESQAAYLADPALSLGQQPGVASSALNNKALRQATYIVACLAQFLVNTTGESVLDDTNESNVLATMALAWPNSTLPTLTKLTITGSVAGYVFTCSSANATVGATYTNNGNTYTVLGTISSGTLLFCSGTSSPTSSGTLTKSGGTGDSSITFSANEALATYTTPANVKYLKIKMAGAGGGGAGSAGGGAGGAGGNTYFGVNLLAANGGAGGTYNSAGTVGGLGGSASLGSGPSGYTYTGGAGSPAETNGISGSCAGSNGGINSFAGGSGGGTPNSGAATTAAANSGAGGASGGSGASATPASGGGAGGYLEAMIGSPAATYYYAIGAAGAAGSTGSGGASAAGAAGIIIIEEHYTG